MSQSVVIEQHGIIGITGIGFLDPIEGAISFFDRLDNRIVLCIELLIIRYGFRTLIGHIF